MTRPMWTFNALLLAVASWIPTAFAQQPVTVPVFDVVSVKPHPAGDTNARMQTTGDGIQVKNLSLDQIIRGAYGLTFSGQLVGAPSWVASEHFDLDAKVAPADVKAFRALNQENIHLMVHPILAERFKLAVHHETRIMPAYALVIAKSVSRLKVATPGDLYANGMKSGDGIARANSVAVSRERSEVHMIGQGVTIGRLVDVLSQQDEGRIVVDKSGLAATYDFTLVWAVDDAANTAATASESTAPTLFTALEEQLGLKLEATKAPVDCLIIDHVEHLSEN